MQHDHTSDYYKATEFCFACYTERREREKIAFQQQLECVFADGRAVIESLGKSKTSWRVTGCTVIEGFSEPGYTYKPFIASAMTPAYLAEHLTNRHYGFDTGIEITA
jgi:hypothetical protein